MHPWDYRNILLYDINTDSRVKIFGVYQVDHDGLDLYENALEEAAELATQADNAMYTARSRIPVTDPAGEIDEYSAEHVEYERLRRLASVAHRKTIAAEGAMRAYIMSFPSLAYQEIKLWRANSTFPLSGERFEV